MTEEKIQLLQERLKLLYPRLKKCDICPRNCRVNRLKGEKGFCGTGKDLIVYTAFLHQGEEPGISAGKGSGTVFFSGCNLKCSYCQNFKFSQNLSGTKVSEKELAGIFLKLQKNKAANINLVTPNHFLPQVLSALLLAFKKGLLLPLVYNTSGYDTEDIIKHLKGIIDIYLTDLKYYNPQTANRFSNASDYPKAALSSIQAMHEGVKTIWDNDILSQGLIIRHLVLPGEVEDSKLILKWIKDTCPRALTSVMFQYQPFHDAAGHKQINRKLNYNEYTQISDYIQEIGLAGWIQEFDQSETLAGIHFKPGFLDI